MECDVSDFILMLIMSETLNVVFKYFLYLMEYDIPVSQSWMSHSILNYLATFSIDKKHYCVILKFEKD